MGQNQIVFTNTNDANTFVEILLRPNKEFPKGMTVVM